MSQLVKNLKLSTDLDMLYRNNTTTEDFEGEKIKIATITSGSGESAVSTEIFAPNGSNTTGSELRKILPDFYSSAKDFKNGILPIGTHDGMNESTQNGLFYYDASTGKISRSNVTVGRFASIIRIVDDVIGFDGFLAVTSCRSNNDKLIVYKSNDGKVWTILKELKDIVYGNQFYAWSQIIWDKVNHVVILNPNYVFKHEREQRIPEYVPGETPIFHFTRNLTDWFDYKDAQYFIGGFESAASICAVDGKLYAWLSYTENINILCWSNENYKFQQTTTIPYSGLVNQAMQHEGQYTCGPNGELVLMIIEEVKNNYRYYYSADRTNWIYLEYNKSYGSARNFLIENEHIFAVTYAGYVISTDLNSKESSIFADLNGSIISSVRLEAVAKYEDEYFVFGRGKINGKDAGGAWKITADKNVEFLTYVDVDQQKFDLYPLFENIEELAKNASTIDIVEKINSIIKALKLSNFIFK